MNKRGFWLFALMIVLAAGPAFAQTSGGSAGSIQGVVTDESGAVLPGVTVSATGTDQMGVRTATTTAQGLYRLIGLEAGVYKLVFEISGFGKVVRDNIRVGIGFTATVDTKMSVKSLSEEVTVTGESTTLDTTATRVQTNFDKDTLDALPNARDMWSLLSETPAVSLNRFDVGGSTAGTQTTYVAYGNGGQNRPLVEGINTTEGTSASGFYFDYGSFDEVIIGAAGNSAEMPSGGVITNFVGKSGGNKFSGEVYYEKEWQGIQSTNITQDQLNRGAVNLAARAIQQLGLHRDEGNTLIDYKNLNASLGGPIIKDKLWVWGGILRQQNVTYQPPAGAILDGTPFQTKLMNYTGKLTYQMTPRDKFVGYLQYGIKQQPTRLDNVNSISPLHLTSSSTVLQDSPSWVGKLEYNRSIGDRGYLEVRAGEFGYNFGQTSNGQDPRREDLATAEVTGGGRDWELDRRRKQAFAAYTFFLDNKLGGNHQFKVGGEIQHETGEYLIPSAWGNIVQTLNSGAAANVRLYAPVDSINGLRNYGLYITDAYTKDRLTINLGGRFDRYRSFIPAQSRPASRFDPVGVNVAAIDNIKTFNHVAPRLGLIYKLTGDGKTAIKANYGRYYFNLGVGFAEAVNPNSPGPGSNGPFRQYNWTDRNGDRLWQPGEEGALTADNINTNPNFDPNVAFAPNLKNSHTDELSFWLERELPGAIGARVGYVWKMDRDGYHVENVLRPRSGYTTPATIADPGRDGNAATTADNQTINVFNFSGNPSAIQNLLLNPEGFEADYKSIEVAVNRRFVNKFSLTSSILFTNTQEWTTMYFGGGAWGNAGTQASLFSGFGNSASSGFPVSPNDQREKTDFWTYNFKAFGTWEPGWSTRLTPILRIQQGYPYARGVAGTLNYGTQNVQAEPLGAFRLPTIKQLDLRADKTFKLQGRVKLSVLVDVYNVFNSNVELNLRHTTGTFVIAETNARVQTFQSPVTILPPRIARLSGRLSW